MLFLDHYIIKILKTEGNNFLFKFLIKHTRVIRFNYVVNDQFKISQYISYVIYNYIHVYDIFGYNLLSIMEKSEYFSYKCFAIYLYRTYLNEINKAQIGPF